MKWLRQIILGLPAAIQIYSLVMDTKDSSAMFT